MKKKILSLTLALGLCLGLLPATVLAAQDNGLTVSFETAVFSVSEETFVRALPEPASLDQCGEGEYVTVCALISNPTGAAVTLQKPCIRIDGGKELYWNDFTLEAGKTVRCHVYHVNAAYLTPGLHTAAIYASGDLLASGRFSIGRDWSKVLKLPTQAQIAARPADERSPYMATWLSVGQGVQYDAYSVDFKSDHIPYGTYSSAFNGYLDFSGSGDQDMTIDNNGHISLYGGLQLAEEGKTGNSILSFWDIYCTDRDGEVTVIRPERVYPEETTDNDSFGNEGEGAHTLRPYDWQAGRWYRMLLQCGTSRTTGNTTVEQWFLDLTTNEWTHVCTYDVGLKNCCFVGNIALFSENFLKQYAGGVRSLEFTNVRVHTNEGWRDIVSTTSGITLQNSGVHANAYGSWEAGADGNSFYMITTGVSGWGRTEKTGALTIQNRESGDPRAPIEPEPATPSTPAAEAASATPTNDSLTADGVLQAPTVYKINDSNYFKIRDLAAILNGTDKQFSVGYDSALQSVTATTGQGYEKTSADLAGAPAGGAKTAQPSNDAIYINGKKVAAEVYKIDGSNYFKLRDLGKALDFYVGWSAEKGMYIETDKGYTE